MPARLLILGEVGLHREALAGSLGRDERFEVVAGAASVEEALEVLEDVEVDVVLVDTSMSERRDTVRTLATVGPPEVKLVALDVPEVESEVVAVAEAGASAYVTRDASMEDLVAVLQSVERGEVLCSPGMVAKLFHRVATLSRERGLEPIDEKLTARELDVLRLIEEGLSNKEIATALSIELPTAKNHVHRILEKLHVHRRTEAAARARRHGLARLGGLANGHTS
jgi:two-component system, NarL family, nitrate/nitrite response regulator NarL